MSPGFEPSRDQYLLLIEGNDGKNALWLAEKGRGNVAKDETRRWFRAQSTVPHVNSQDLTEGKEGGRKGAGC